jgi:hypothetical protein
VRKSSVGAQNFQGTIFHLVTTVHTSMIVSSTNLLSCPHALAYLQNHVIYLFIHSFVVTPPPTHPNKTPIVLGQTSPYNHLASNLTITLTLTLTGTSVQVETYSNIRRFRFLFYFRKIKSEIGGY